MEFPYKVTNEVVLKTALVNIALSVNRIQDTGIIIIIIIVISIIIVIIIIVIISIIYNIY